MVIKVRKRSGKIVELNREKIGQAIGKSVTSVGFGGSSELATSLSDIVIERINIDAKDDQAIVSVEKIQDLVERVLIEEGHYAIAKAYIIYREKRREVRETVIEGMAQKGMSGKLSIKKRNGSIQHFDLSKAQAKLNRVSVGFENQISYELITKEFMRNIFEGIEAPDIDKALIMAVSSYIEKDPAYSFIGSRLFLEKIYREVFGQKVNDMNFQDLYTESFTKSIKTGHEDGLLDDRMLTFDFQKISEAIKPKRDLLLQYMGAQTLYERYFIRVNKQITETPQYFFMRVAMGLALDEENKEEKAIEFYELLSTLRFMSSTPTLFNSGLKKSQLSSCYLTTVEDDLGGIFKNYSDNAQLSKWSGGLGNDWTNIRATGAHIKSTGVESQGVIPFLKIASDVTAAINRSGRRRGATCAYLETWHLDVEEFLDLRKNTGDDRRRTHDMNTSNWIPDLFMKRVMNNEEWTLFSPNEVPELHETYGSDFERRYIEYEQKAKAGKMEQNKTVSATKLWRKMISMLFETGHPWITFKDPCNIRSPQDHVGVIHSSNLCTEITLNTSKDEIAVCNLGSINLASHVNSIGEIDYDLMKKTVFTAINMLDNVVDLNFYPTIEAKNSNLKHRPIGLGIMGLQDLFFKMNLAFDSPKALDTSDELMENISYNAIMASSTIASKKGSYSSFPGSKWDRGIFPLDTIELLEKERGMPIEVSKKKRLNWQFLKEYVKEHGMRNSNTMAIAPTATISTISGCYPCIEPIYKNIYVKSNMSGEFTIINSYLIHDLKKLNLWNDTMIDKLKYYDGNLSQINDVPIELANKYKESFDVDPMVSIMHNALRGKWIDQSQSFNVFIKGTSGKLISDVYQYAWRAGLKTTYYLRSLAATQIEKSTLSAKEFGFTQKREYKDEEPKTTNNIPTLVPSTLVNPNVIEQERIKELEQPQENQNTQTTPMPLLQQNNKPTEQSSSIFNPSGAPIKLCRIEDPDCEACQ